MPMSEEKNLSEVVAVAQDGQSKEVAQKSFPKILTILPILQRPVFPGLTLPITFQGKEFLTAIQQVMERENGYVGLVYAEEVESEQAEERDFDFREVGVIFQIYRVNQTGPETMQVLGQAYGRIIRKHVLLVKPTLRWEVEYHLDPEERPSQELKAYMLAISADIKELLKLNPVLKEQVNLIMSQLDMERPGPTMDLIANLLSADADQLQELLETFDLIERAQLLLKLLREELELSRLKQKIQKQIDEAVNKQQKEFFLREQLKAIKRELGMEKDEAETEIEKIQKKLEGKQLPEEAQKVVEEELDKLRMLNAQSPEFHVVRNYLDLIAELPWGIYSKDNRDLERARSILDRDHYGLKDVKERILEMLSIIVKRSTVSGTVICLVGPPGVGKTSIGKSIAEALSRKFFRFSVGGMVDEAEIKGHRRTYIGAMPGKLIQALKRVQTSNPVIMLDEIDKIGTSFRGDPASALLEVLDPEQNHNFLDHYLDIPYDLSQVLFITTANQLDTIPGPLLDRMDVIRLSGYILQEKVEIAKRYLLPRQLQENGFATDELHIEDDAIAYIVEHYAREAGVRNLEKQIRRIVRKISLKAALGEAVPQVVKKDMIEDLLGKPIYTTERLYKTPRPGVVLGLAWTAFGGATLYIEAIGVRSKSAGFKQTGQLGDVMQESAQIAYSYVRALLDQTRPDNDFLQKHFVHLHVPAGATPKDGPSAGITMALALYSLATGEAVSDDLAMTGELTLTGKVLPIGGVKEKIIAARRVGITHVILPAANRKDFEELPDYLKDGLHVHFVEWFEEVLAVAYAKNEVTG